MHTVHVNTYILHRSACSEKLHRFYHRRLSLPPKKKIHDSTTYSNLRIRKTETNLFVTFSINGIVLFTCSAGGASARKKNRRRRLAANSIGSRFAGFMRYMSKRGRSHIFRNIIIVLHCPVSFLRSFMQGYRYAVYKYRKQQVTNWLREFVHLRWYLRFIRRRVGLIYKLFRGLYGAIGIAVPSYQSYSIMAYGLLSSFLIRYFSGMCNELRSFAMYAIIRDSAIMHDAQAHDDGSARTDSFITSISSCAGTGMARVACADTHGTCVPSRTVVYPPSRMKLQLARKRGRTVQVEFSVFCRTTIDSYHARDRSRLLDLLPFFIRGKAQHNVLCAATLMHTAHFGYACLKSLAFINAAGRVRVPFIIKSFCRNIVCRIAGTRVIPEAYSYNAVIRRLIKRIDSKSAFIHNNATEYRTKYRRLSMLRIIFSRRLHAGKFSGAKRRRARRNGAKRKQHSLSRMHALYDEQRRHASSDARSRVANMHWRNGSYRYKPTRAMRLYHMRRFYTFFRIVYIVDRSSVPHNGCRLRRK